MFSEKVRNISSSQKRQSECFGRAAAPSELWDGAFAKVLLKQAVGSPV